MALALRYADAAVRKEVVAEECLRAAALIGGVADRARHHAVDHDLSADACEAFEDAHAAAQPFDPRLDLDDLAGADWTAEAHPLDPGKQYQLAAVLRLRQDQDAANLGHTLGQDRRRQ